MKKLIGLSLRQCCQDMAMGKVDPRQVKKIISRTSIRTPKSMEEVISTYQLFDWGHDKPESFAGGITVRTLSHAKGGKEIAEKAGKIFRQMFAEGKVEQPRLTEGRCPDLEATGSHWITNKKQIKWMECSASPVRLR
jgi:hypothetical protein